MKNKPLEQLSDMCNCPSQQRTKLIIKLARFRHGKKILWRQQQPTEYLLNMKVNTHFNMKNVFDPNISTQLISYKDQHFLLWYVCNVAKIFNISYAP